MGASNGQAMGHDMANHQEDDEEDDDRGACSKLDRSFE